MHGLFGSSRNWMAHARKLESLARVHLVDLRNHGQSPWSDAMDYPLMAADLRQYLRDQGIERTHLVGHSMGGKTAIQFALDHGDLINDLVIADIAPVAYDRSYDGHLDAMRTSPLASGDRQSVDHHLAERIEDRSIRAFLLQNLVRHDDGLAWRINVEGIQNAMPAIMDAPVLGEARRHTGRTLFLRGDSSNYVLPEHQELIKTLFPQSRTVSLKKAGHWLHADQPDAFVNSLKLFFQL